MYFEDKYFEKFDFTKEQIRKNFDNAVKDLSIAQKDAIIDVKFNYAYAAFIKAGIALLSFHNRKVKSVPGHHVKIIESMSAILRDKNIETIGNLMRSKRNTDFYDGGIEVTQKESGEYIEFTENVLTKVKNAIKI